MITIKNKEYKFKFTLRAMLIFEQVTKRNFSIQSLTDEYIYLYCMIMANNPDSNLTFDDLMDAMDEDPTIMIQFKEELNNYNKKAALFINEDDADSKKKS